VHLDNPAGRLYRMFDRARNIPNHPAAQGWAQIFGVDADDLPGLMRGVASVVDTVVDVRKQVSALEDDDPDLVLSSYHEIEQTVKMFPLMSNNNMGWFLTHLKDTGMQSLAWCSSLLHRRRPEPALSQETCESLIEQIRNLRAEVRAAEGLDPQLRKFVLRHLRQIEFALIDHDLFGTVPVEQALDEAVGALGRKPHLIDRLKQSPVVSGFVTVLMAVDVALGMAVNTKAIAAPPDQPPAPSPAVTDLIQRCEVRLELPAGAGQPATTGDLQEPLVTADAGS
jgi:hypothetical protein